MPRPSCVDPAASAAGHVEQPMPVRNDRPSIQSLVRADLGVRHPLGPARFAVAADIDAREQVGIERYGTSLQPFNRRDALRDCYEELADGAVYAKQAVVEADERGEDSARLVRLYDDLLRLACFVRELRGNRG